MDYNLQLWMTNGWLCTDSLTFTLHHHVENLWFLWGFQYLGEVQGTIFAVEDSRHVIGVEEEAVFLPADVCERWVWQEMAVQNPGPSVR